MEMARKHPVLNPGTGNGFIEGLCQGVARARRV